MSENEVENAYIGDSSYPTPLSSYESFSVPKYPPNEYIISYTSTMESLVRKLRLSMEMYREVIIHANSILLWDKPWHPYAITGGCTTVFMMLWLCEPNILTVLSLVGLLITISDYILPSIISSLYKSELWTPDKQQQYDDVCANIILYKTKVELLFTSYYRMRVTNPKMYFGITIFGLTFLAWIGGTISNLFLLYLLVLFIFLLPGMSTNGLFNKGTDTLSKLFTELVENAKSKVGQKKLQ